MIERARSFARRIVGFLRPPARPALRLHHFDYIEAPHIVRRADGFVLRYRIATRGAMVQVHPPFFKVTPTKAYYYFGGAASATDPGEPRERSLDRDGLTEYAERNSVYWLDPDGSETHLEIVDESQRGR